MRREQTQNEDPTQGTQPQLLLVCLQRTNCLVLTGNSSDRATIIMQASIRKQQFASRSGDQYKNDTEKDANDTSRKKYRETSHIIFGRGSKEQATIDEIAVHRELHFWHCKAEKGTGCR